MSGKALNPQDDSNATSTKPTLVSNGASLRKWFKDCTTPSSDDGTEPRARDLNALLYQMRYAADQLNVADDDDETLLYKLLRAIVARQGFANSFQGYGTPGDYTFTVPANVYFIDVEVWGAGGGGGGADAHAFGGSGGNGGGYAHKLMAVTPGSNISVRVGAGGSNGFAADGGNGGESYFGSVQATGGAGGKTGTASAPGAVSLTVGGGINGDVNFEGGRAGQGGGPADTYAAVGGPGGGASRGGAGGGTTTGDGQAPAAPGGGGGGGGGYGGASSRGSAGAPGAVHLRWFSL